jgi:hypothetical protein
LVKQQTHPQFEFYIMVASFFDVIVHLFGFFYDKQPTQQNKNKNKKRKPKNKKTKHKTQKTKNKKQKQKQTKKKQKKRREPGPVSSLNSSARPGRPSPRGTLLQGTGPHALPRRRLHPRLRSRTPTPWH